MVMMLPKVANAVTVTESEFRTAAAMPDRVGAIASFYGGGLVTNMPNSPHLQASKTKAQLPWQSPPTTTRGRPMRRMC